jgi:hypothetical protein
LGLLELEGKLSNGGSHLTGCRHQLVDPMLQGFPMFHNLTSEERTPASTPHLIKELHLLP